MATIAPTTIDADGMLASSRISQKRYTAIEHGPLIAANAIVVHQTDSRTAVSSLSAYTNDGNGAHFLIDKDGTIYQTASVHKRCFHVGRLIKSRCLELKGSACQDPQLAKALTLRWTKQIAEIDRIERQKSYPDRFPVNQDSIGIELVGRHVDDRSYEQPTALQNNALKWLVGELCRLLAIGTTEVFRHPAVSYKNTGEAQGAAW